MIDLGRLARDLGLPADRVQRTVALLDEGNTVPFITRYRKDTTGGLDEEQVRQVQQRLLKLRMLDERKQTILKSIESQGRLTPELAQHIQEAQSTKRLEDLYLPYKPKKQTLATIARQRGLEPLAREILEAAPSAANLDQRAADFISEDRQLRSVAEVLHGVGHLLAERFSERAELRDALRRIFHKTGRLVSTRIAPAATQDQRRQPPGETTSSKQAASEPAAPTAVEPSSIPQAPEAPALEPQPAAGPPPAPAEAATCVTAEQTQAAVASATEGQGEASVLETPEASPDLSAIPSAPDATIVDAPVEAMEPTAPEQTSASEPPADDQSVLRAEASPSVTGAEAPAPETSAAPPAPKSARAAGVDKKQKAKADKKDKKDKKKQRQEAAFKDYYDFQESLARIPPHRILAINRGERASVLRAKLEGDFEALVAEAEQLLVPADHPHRDFLKGCSRDALTRLVLPSLEREIRRELTEHAEKHAVDVFVRNLRNLLLQPPINGHRVLAIDPGFRSGCKLVAIDEFGNVQGHATIFIVGKEERRKAGRAKLAEMIRTHRSSVVAIGNGTACRQTELLVAEVLAEELADQEVSYVIVNEAGASVYSTSPAGREELPNYDPVMRSAISIGRRLLDPLSELVKINPANIGVGLYQHDVRAKHLRDSLDAVVESCVNFVGVDANTASPALLRYVSGLNQLTARRLYEYRREHGPFRTREDFKRVPGFGEATFVQSAGFLKITDGDNPLDATWIHPESYEVARRLLDRIGSSVQELAARVHRERPAPAPTEAAAAAPEPSPEPPAAQPATELPATSTPEAALPPEPSGAEPPEESAPTSGQSPPPATTATPPPATTAANGAPSLADRTINVDVDATAAELGIGQLLLKDLLAALNRPTRDPREDLPRPIFRRGIMKLEDLRAGMELTGTVLNVVDFGAFVDIGLPDSGLVHISRLADRYVRDPHEVVSVGDILSVWVVEVDKERRRVSLTAVKPGSERPKPDQRRPAEGRQRPAKSQRPARSSGAPARGGSGGKQLRPPKFKQRHDKPRKPKPVTPITKAMEEGKEPMRSFSDLLQFYEKKGTDDDEPNGSGQQEKT